MATKAWKPAAAITTLRKQVDKSHPDRDRRSDGIVGDLDHASRKSDHNPNARGFVLALDIDEDVKKLPKRKDDSETWMMRFANQLKQYAASGLPGSERIAYVIYEDRITSGTYKTSWWRWRGKNYGHREHVHVSMTTKAEKNGAPFPLPIFGYPSFADQKAALAKAKASAKKAPVKKVAAKKTPVKK